MDYVGVGKGLNFAVSHISDGQPIVASTISEPSILSKMNFHLSSNVHLYHHAIFA